MKPSLASVASSENIQYTVLHYLFLAFYIIIFTGTFACSRNKLNQHSNANVCSIQYVKKVFAFVLNFKLIFMLL